METAGGGGWWTSDLVPVHYRRKETGQLCTMIVRRAAGDPRVTVSECERSRGFRARFGDEIDAELEAIGA